MAARFVRKICIKSLIRLIPAAIIFTASLAAMPSYDDVLLVVKRGDPQSVEIGDYFKAARGIPSVNVAVLNIPGTYGTVISKAQRDTLVSDISAHISANGLAGKINYIVLSSGIPVKAYDNPAGTAKSMIDVHLMYRLSAMYPVSAWMTNNPYAYIRKENFTNRSNIKFSRNKYRYCIVSRLDGPGTSAIKKMIDSAGAAAYDSYRTGVKYIVDSMQNPAVEHHADTKANIESRGGVFQMWDNSQGFVHDITDINFLDCDWVRGPAGGMTRNSVIAYFPHQWKRLSFKPGSLMCVYRSFPTGNGYFSAFQYGLHTYYNGTLVTNTRPDGSDSMLHNMAGVAVNEDDHTVWCALSVPPFFDGVSPDDIITADYMRRNGGGIAVYDTAGNCTANYTKSNTPGLLCDAVYTTAYDAFNHRMWVGTFSGICYYDTVAKTWGTPAGLSHTDGARVAQIYVDPTTSGRKVYITFTAGGTGWRVPNKLASYQRVFEYDVPSDTVFARSLGINDMFYSAQVVKTASNIIWLRYATNKNNVSSHYIRKVDLTTDAKLYELALADIAGTDYTPPQAHIICPMNLLADTSTGRAYIYSPIGTTNAGAAIKNGVLRIADGAAPAAAVWGSSAWTFPANNTAGTKVFRNPKHPDRVYLLLRRYTLAQSSSGGIIEFSASNTAGTEWKAGSTSLINVNDAVFDMQTDGKLWFVRHQNMNAETEQYPIYEFFNNGLTAAMGGFSHDAFQYDGNAFTTPVPAAELISTSQPEYHLYSPENNGTQVLNTPFQMHSTALLLLDGFYMAEARFASLPQYPLQGDNGYRGHLLVMDPKTAPYAPRVDLASTDTRITEDNGVYGLRVKIFSPMQVITNRGFITSTINAATVKLFDRHTNEITAEKISATNVADGTTEIVYTTRASLVSGDPYLLVLQCGVNGIKNTAGASLVNTRPDEFSDTVSITYTYTAHPPASAVPPAGLALWLEADTLASTLGSGDAVAVWKATAGVDAVRCTAALPNGKAPTAPTFTADAMNGRPAVRFDGADNQMTIPGGIAARLAGKPFSIFMVSRSASATFGITGNSANGSGGVPRLYIERQGTVYNESTNLAQVPTQASAVELVSSLHDGTNILTGYLNGVKSKDIPAPVSAIGGTGDMAIPFWPGTPQAGDISALLIYDRRLSDAERTGVEQYLIQKYSIETVVTNVTPSVGSNVILIGDSIRMGYQPYVSNLLTNLIPVSGPVENCQHSGIVTQYLKTWVLDKKPALVHMNAGLHDLIENKSTGIFQIPTNQYAANLDYIFRTLRDNGIRVIWSTTTPVIDTTYSNWNLGQTFIRHDADVVMYNNVARAVLSRYNIPVFDLYAYVKTLDPGAVYYQDGLHYTAAGYRLLAAQVSAFISNNLSNTAAPIIVPPAVSVSHGSLTTNGAFTVTISVDKNFGCWSTNGAAFQQFTTAGLALPITATTTLRVYGASNGVSSATNSYVYTIVPSAMSCDLVITGISWTPLNPKPGTNVTMSATVSNAGTGASSNAFLAVVFRVDGTNLSYGGSTMSLAAGAAITVSGAYAWSGSPTNVWKASAGTHTVFALADDINRIPEMNDANNSNSAALTVSSGPVELYLEAESGTLTAPMAKYADDTNAAGSYIMAPPVNNSLAVAPSNGMAVYTFTVPESGVYRVSGRIKAVNGTHDSFWVKMNTGAWVQWNNIGYTNSALMKSNWNWVEVFNTAAAGSVMEYSLTAGVQNTLSIAYREDTTKLDRLLIRKMETTPAPVTAAFAMSIVPAVTAEESSSQCYPQPEFRPVPSVTASASVDAVKNTVSMKYAVNMNGVELYEIWYAISETGKNTWQTITPDAVIGGIFSLTSLSGDNAWQVRGLTPGKNYDLRVTAVADQGAGTPYIIRNVATSRLFSEQQHADMAAVLNNPYRGGSEGMTFVNLPAGSTVKIYTVAGFLIASLIAGNDRSGRITWNMLCDDGQKARPGVYICRISSHAGGGTLKVVVQK